MDHVADGDDDHVGVDLEAQGPVGLEAHHGPHQLVVAAHHPRLAAQGDGGRLLLAAQGEASVRGQHGGVAALQPHQEGGDERLAVHGAAGEVVEGDGEVGDLGRELVGPVHVEADADDHGGEVRPGQRGLGEHAGELALLAPGGG